VRVNVERPQLERAGRVPSAQPHRGVDVGCGREAADRHVDGIVK